MSVDPQSFSLLIGAVIAVAGAIAGVGHSVAAIIRENYRGKALLIRAKSDAELARRLGVPTPEPPPVVIDTQPVVPLLGTLRRALRLSSDR